MSPTLETALRVRNILEVYLLDPQTPFHALASNISLCTTYKCSKLTSEGLATFALSADLRGDELALPVGHRVVDMRLTPHGPVALSFSHVTRVILETGATRVQFDQVKEYSSNDIEAMARDVMFFLCNNRQPPP